MATSSPSFLCVTQTLLKQTSLQENMTLGLVSNATEVPSSDAYPCMDVVSIPGIISSETRQGLASFSGSYSAVHGYVSTAVCLFGLMSNTANIIVLTRKNMISSTNTILMWLAVADLLTMMSYLPFAIHFYIMKEPELKVFQTRSFGWIIFLMFHASFSIVCHTVAIWLTIALAIFRYIYICMPTMGSVYCSLRRAKFTIFAVYALTVVVCVPNYITNRFEVSDLSQADSFDSGTTSTVSVTKNFTGLKDNMSKAEEEAIIYNPTQWENSQAAEITMQVSHVLIYTLSVSFVLLCFVFLAMARIPLREIYKTRYKTAVIVYDVRAVGHRFWRDVIRGKSGEEIDTAKDETKVFIDFIDLSAAADITLCIRTPLL